MKIDRIKVDGKSAKPKTSAESKGAIDGVLEHDADVNSGKAQLMQVVSKKNGSIINCMNSFTHLGIYARA